MKAFVFSFCTGMHSRGDKNSMKKHFAVAFSKKSLKMILAMILALTFMLSAGITPTPAFAEYDGDSPVNRREPLSDDELASLTWTLGEPLGAQVSDADWGDDPEEIVEVAVQFITPPATALRLLDIDDGNMRIQSAGAYQQQALAAHADFYAQLERLTPDTPPGVVTPFSAPFEILSEHHSLFNGVFMRVPQYMVYQIAQLPEVFSVTPNYEVFLLTDNNELSGEFDTTLDSDTVTTFSPSPTPTPNPTFMQRSKNLFQVGYIHNTLDISGRGVSVAVLDTGIDHTHPEFASFLDGGIIRGHDFTNSPNGLFDVNGHGTHVSGIVTAIAPDVELWHFKVMYDGGGGTVRRVLQGIEAAVAYGIDVINLSIGLDPRNVTSPNHLLNRTVNNAVLYGMVVVTAVGNFGPNSSTAASPSIASLSIAVGNSVGNSSVHHNSSVGPVVQTGHIKPDVVAPGTEIVSTWPSSPTATPPIPPGYRAQTGTSMAAPHVAAVAALLLERHPSAEPYEIKALIMNTAVSLLDYPDSVFCIGAGFVNPRAALTTDMLATTRHVIPTGAEGVTSLETMASLSFGAMTRNNPGRWAASIPVTIHNRSTSTQQYLITRVFSSRLTGRPSLTTPDSVTIAAGETATFYATVQINSNTTLGLHYGFVNISGNNNVARVPFATAVISPWEAPIPRSQLFHDSRQHWAAGVRANTTNYIGWALANNITTGIAGTHPPEFRPNANVSRAQFTAFLYRIAEGGTPPRRPTLGFRDMNQGQWHHNYVAWAYSRGIVTGFHGDNTFRPGRPITREQLVVMLHRYVGGPAVPNVLGNFPDSGQVSSWARDSMNWAAHHGIIGRGGGNLNPGGNATRAETLAMLHRVVTTFNIPAP